jgi:RimJ/RimL family protein N-acetyltransferase
LLDEVASNGLMDDLPGTISAPPLVLRRSQVADAAALAVAVAESLDHLAPWLQWATPEAATVASQATRLSRGTWGADLWDFVMAVGDGELVGACGLHRRDASTVAIGYWVHVRHVRHGYATAAARGLTQTAVALPGIQRVEIQCDEANVAGAAVPRRLGYLLDRIEDRAIEARGQTGRLMTWTLDRATR